MKRITAFFYRRLWKNFVIVNVRSSWKTPRQKAQEEKKTESNNNINIFIACILRSID